MCRLMGCWAFKKWSRDEYIGEGDSAFLQLFGNLIKMSGIGSSYSVSHRIKDTKFQ